MTLNENNQTRTAQLLESIGAFDGSEDRLDRLQSQLQGAISLFESDGSGVSEIVRLAEADVEAIRFTQVLEEQGEAVRRRMVLLSQGLERLLGE
ncbi:hypothetical protein [Myceligenerans crystallogenes]|uniref:Uncharacterized protein n=1 Tax=Myceligenerans crystallogenes TaxID=316335 RepID=A0ABN2N2I3_9MICO